MILSTGKQTTFIMISRRVLRLPCGVESKLQRYSSEDDLLTRYRDIKIYGSGVINGNGQAWWDGFSGAEILDPNNKYYRPILFLTDNATNVEVSGLHLKDSPCWTTFFVRTKNVVFDNVYIDAVSTNASVIHQVIYVT
jgi:hypothetical protein